VEAAVIFSDTVSNDFFTRFLQAPRPMTRSLLPLLLLLAGGAQAQPVCDQDRVGAVACMAGRLCACGYQRGGVVSGRPEGYRWDCGVLRPACAEPPATLPAAPLPPVELLLPLHPPPRSPWHR
jgi:hypothetical protein